MLLKNLLKNIVALAVLSLLCTSCAVRDPDSAGYADENAPQTRSAENLGMAYRVGKDVPINDSKAAYWFQQAAEQGNAEAANRLGYMYSSGKGVGQNYQLALQWYQQAADAGIASAKYNLGLLYEHGLGTPVDKEKARELFREAAALGFAPARRKI